MPSLPTFYLDEENEHVSPPSFLHEYSLDEVARTQLAESLASFPNPYPELLGSQVDHAHLHVLQALPASARCLLSSLGEGQSKEAPLAVLMHGLPTIEDDVPTPLPRTLPTATRSNFSPEGAAIGLSRTLGYIFRIDDEHGYVPGTVIPDLKHGREKSNAGCYVRLGHHNEQPYSRFGSPDFLTLYGMRSDPGTRVTTTLADIRRLIGNMETPMFQALQDPGFEFLAPQSIKGGTLPSRRGPIVDGDLCTGIIRYKEDGVKPPKGNAAAAEALQYIERHLPNHSVSVEVPPGSALMFNSRFLTHARDAWTPTGDQRQARWLLRVLVAQRPMTVGDKDLTISFPSWGAPKKADSTGNGSAVARWAA